MQAVNLIPGDARRRGLSTSTGLPFFGLTGGLVVVLLAIVLLVSAHSRVTTQEAQLRGTQEATARWTAVAGSYERDVSLDAQYGATIQSVETLAAQRYRWSALLGQLAGAVPKSTVLSSLSSSASSATSATATATASSGSTGSASAPSLITLAACTFSQSTVAQTMENLRRVHGVSGVTLSSSTTSSPSKACPHRPVTFGVTLSFATPASSSSASTTSAPAAPTTTTSSAGAS